MNESCSLSLPVRFILGICLFSRMVLSAEQVFETDSGSDSALKTVLHSSVRIEMIHNPNQELADNERCMESFNVLKTRFSKKYWVRKVDLSKGLLAKKESFPAHFFQPGGQGCRFGLRLGGDRIMFEGTYFSPTLLTRWVARRVKRKIHSIHSAEDFYRLSNEYFGGIYIYKGSQERGLKHLVKHRLRILAMEFPYTKIYYSFDPDVNSTLKFQDGHSLVLIRNFEDGHKTLFQKKPILLSDMRLMVSKYRFPFILWWNQSVFEYITQERQNVVILIMRRTKNYHLEAGFERVARSFKEKGYRFGVLDVHGNRVTHSKRLMLDMMGIIPKSVIPSLVSVTFNLETGYKLLKCNNMTMGGMKGFLEEVVRDSSPSEGHCIQNQFLPSLKSFGAVKPLNYDSFRDLQKIKSISKHMVLVYRSGLKSSKRYLLAFKKVANLPSQERVSSKYFLFDRSLNAVPPFLQHVRHLPGKGAYIVQFKARSTENESLYLVDIRSFDSKKSMLKVMGVTGRAKGEGDESGKGGLSHVEKDGDTLAS